MKKLDRNISDEEILFSSLNPGRLGRFDKEKAYMSFIHRVERKRSINRRRTIWAVSSFAACICLATGIFSYNAGRTAIESKMADIVVEAPQGSRLKMALPDGTTVWLNAGSSIAYSQSFGISERNVRMSGEGYFEVVKNASLPFNVQSDNLHVKVLGTKFNVRDYKTDDKAFVNLSEGSVSMSHLSNMECETRLVPNERCIVDKATGQMLVEAYEAENSIQWINGRLIFDGEALPEIAKDIERSYNIRVFISDESLNGLRFYGDFIRQEQTLTEVLDALSATGKVDYKLREREVHLIPSHD